MGTLQGHSGGIRLHSLANMNVCFIAISLQDISVKTTAVDPLTASTAKNHWPQDHAQINLLEGLRAKIGHCAPIVPTAHSSYIISPRQQPALWS